MLLAILFAVLAVLVLIELFMFVALFLWFIVDDIRRSRAWGAIGRLMAQQHIRTYLK